MTRLRCATYTRISTDKQAASSMDDQRRKCREFAEGKGWDVVRDFSDEGISGVGSDRPGYKDLLAAAFSLPAPFDAILVDDTSRLSRNTAEAMKLFEHLIFAGVRVISVSQGIDSGNDQADVLFTLHAMMDQTYVKELAQKTHRGLEGLALRGLHTGGHCYGYDRIPAGEGTSKRPVVNQNEASVVRRIFEMSASGVSLKKIAATLNAERATPPRPSAARHNASWCPTAIKAILERDLYRGHMIWNRRKYQKVPGTNRRVARPRPESQWVRTEIPDIRIVTEELWARVRRRFSILQAAYKTCGRGGGLLPRAATSPYLFSGILKCGLCGANLIIVAGQSKGRYQRYGCSAAQNRGTCTNRLTERRERIEEMILSRLQAEVLRPEVIDYVLEEFGRQLTNRLRQNSTKLERMRHRREVLERELKRLTDRLASGTESPSVMRAIADRENELRGITDTLFSTKPGSVEATLKETRAFISKRLTSLRELLARNAATARTELLQHVSEIRMMPDDSGPKPHYVAKGAWDLLGHADSSQEATGGSYVGLRMVAGVGFEPTTSGL
jgi:site-specific DNA recombinase